MMPFRHLYIGTGDDGVNLITPRAYINPENNVFDKAFNDGMDMEEWDDWMKWEGNTTDIIVPAIERRESVASSISSPETWSMDQESVEMGRISTSYHPENGLPFIDAPFDFVESQDLKPTRPGPITRASSAALFQPQQDTRRSIRGYSSLTEAEERNLQDIAMPYHALSKIKISPSIITSTSSVSRSPSAEPEKQARKTRKRKSITDDDVPSALCLSRKRGHNAIEKRYRTNLNDKINLLREALPKLQRSSSNESSKTCDDEDEEDDQEDTKSAQQKCGKAATLTMALEYIKHLELAAQRLGDETCTLQTRIGAFEKLAMSGSMSRGNGVLPPVGLERIELVRKNSETLESIQAEFTQPKPKAASVSGPAKRRGSRQVKA